MFTKQKKDKYFEIGTLSFIVQVCTSIKQWTNNLPTHCSLSECHRVCGQQPLKYVEYNKPLKSNLEQITNGNEVESCF